MFLQALAHSLSVDNRDLWDRDDKLAAAPAYRVVRTFRRMLTSLMGQK